MTIETLTWRNKAILKLTDDTDPRIKAQFGVKKAKLILENTEAIKDFVEAQISTKEVVIC